MPIDEKRLWLGKRVLLYAVYTTALLRRETEHANFNKKIKVRIFLADQRLTAMPPENVQNMFVGLGALIFDVIRVCQYFSLILKVFHLSTPILCTSV